MTDTKKVTVAPGEKTHVSHDTTPFTTDEGVTLANYTVTVTGAVTKVSDSSALGVITAVITATGSGSVVFTTTFSDGQIRVRTMTVTYADK